MNINADILGRIATVTGILAGFSLTTAVRLISDKMNAKKKDSQAKLATATVAILLCATILLVGVVISAAILASRALFFEGMNDAAQAVVIFFTNTTLILLAAGIASFFTGTILSAWILHKYIGILVLCLGVVSLAWAVIVFFLTP